MRPEPQCAPQRQFTVKRGRIVGQRQLRSLDLAMFLAQQPGREADQARLAAAVRAAHLERLAVSERQIQLLEQQPAAAAQRYPFKAQKRAHSAPRSGTRVSV